MAAVKSLRERRQALECGHPTTIECKNLPDITCSTKERVPLPPAPPSGTYHVLGELGRGAMAMVMRAVDTRVKAAAQIRAEDCEASGGYVALKKVYSTETAFAQLARDEFQILKSLDHPNIIRAFDLFIAIDGRPTLVLEFFDGLELGVAVQGFAGGRLPEAAVRSLCPLLISAVGAVHRRNVIHRDVKPQNVLVSRDLRDLKLIDFSSARGVTHLVPMTPAGTRLYAAPEVLAEQPSTKAGDVWGIGLCAYLALSGRLPQHRDGDTSDSPIRTAARRVSFKDMGMPRQANNFLRLCLALNPEGRHTADQLLNAEWFQPCMDINEEDANQFNGSSSTYCPSSTSSIGLSVSEEDDEIVASVRDGPP